MEQLRAYLTSDGWRRDLEATIDDYRSVCQISKKAGLELVELYKRPVVSINAGVFLAAFGSIQAASLTSYYLTRHGTDEKVLSYIASAVDEVVFNGIQVANHYLSQRQKFITENHLDRKGFSKDIFTVLWTQGPGFFTYFFGASEIQSSLMKNLHLGPIVASNTARWSVMLFNRFLHNGLLSVVGYYKSQK